MKHAFQFGDSEIFSTDINELLAEYLSESEQIEDDLYYYTTHSAELNDRLHDEELDADERARLERELMDHENELEYIKLNRAAFLTESDIGNLSTFVNCCMMLNSKWSEGVMIYLDKWLQDDRENYHEVSIEGFTYWLPKE